jgi:hypothetical protein
MDENLSELRRYLEPFEAAQLCRVLAEHGIHGYQVGNMSNSYPGVLQQGNSQGIRVMVAAADEGEARKIADEMFPLRSEFGHLKSIPWLPAFPGARVVIFLAVAFCLLLIGKIAFEHFQHPAGTPYKINVLAPQDLPEP